MENQFSEKEVELMSLLHKYNMEEIITDNECTSYVWYIGSNLKEEGLMVHDSSREKVVANVIECLNNHPEWNKGYFNT